MKQIKRLSLKELGLSKHDKAQRLARNRAMKRRASLMLENASKDKDADNVAIIKELHDVETYLTDAPHSFMMQCANANRIAKGTQIDINALVSKARDYDGVLEMLTDTHSVDGASLRAVAYANYQHAYKFIVRDGKYIPLADVEPGFMNGITNLYLDANTYRDALNDKGLKYMFTKAFGRGLNSVAKRYNDNTLSLDEPLKEMTGGMSKQDVMTYGDMVSKQVETAPQSVYQELRTVYGLEHKECIKIAKNYNIMVSKNSSAHDKSIAKKVIYRVRQKYGYNVQARKLELGDYKKRARRVTSTERVTGITKSDRAIIKRLNKDA